MLFFQCAMMCVGLTSRITPATRSRSDGIVASRIGVLLVRPYLLASNARSIASIPGAALAQAYQCRVPQAVPVPAIERDGLVRQVAVTGYTLALSPAACRLGEVTSRRTKPK